MNKKLNSYIVTFFVLVGLSSSYFALVICLGRVISSSDFVVSHENIDDNSQPVPTITPDSCILGETDDMGDDYLDSIVFLGESTTYGLARYGVLRGGRNTTQVWTGATCADGEVRTSGTLSLSPQIAKTKIFYPNNKTAITIPDAVALSHPSILVVTLGLNNGASYYSEDEFKECYRILISSIMNADQNTRIIIQSLFPVASDCKIKQYTPEKLKLCNSWLVDIASEFEISYLDTFSVLADENGYLLPEYDNKGDGIHLNEQGLNAVIKYVRTHGLPQFRER